MKILFLVKLTTEYGGTTQPSKSGLRNSACFVVDAVNKFAQASLEFCADDNSINKFVYNFKPDICIIEAIWTRPEKLRELIGLYPHIQFVVRVHSRTPFLAMEGNAVGWIKEYAAMATVSFNHEDTSREFEKLGLNNVYLPNIYPQVEFKGAKPLGRRRNYYKIGCFGAIRPFKNQLAQAMAAILFAEKHRASVHFYINYSRIEQRGEGVLKNLRALFAGTRHKLIEVEWLQHDDFVKLLATMDACMQVSFTETFNIVTADCISAHVPVVVGESIGWLNCRKAGPNHESDMAKTLAYVIENKVDLVEDNIHDLIAYNQRAILKWFRFINR